MVDQPSPSQRLMEAFFRFSRLHMLRPKEGHRPPEMHLLHLLNKATASNSAGLKVSDISQLMHVTPPMVTQLVSSLEARGLVTRIMDAEDRRAVRVSITKEGRQVHRQASEAFLASFNRLADRLGREKSIQLAELLTEVYEFVSSEKASYVPNTSNKQNEEVECNLGTDSQLVPKATHHNESTSGGDALL